MKRTLLTLLVMLFSLIQLSAQEHNGFFPTGMRWKEVIANPYSSSMDTISAVLYEIGEDTLVNDKLCKTIYRNGNLLGRWIFEENGKVWILTEDYPDPIKIYDFNWHDENSSYYEVLKINEISQETKLVKSYLSQEEIKNVIFNNDSVEYMMDYEGAVIRFIGRVSDLNRNSCLLGYKIVEPVLPGVEYQKVLWIVRNNQEIYRSETAEEWILNIPDVIYERPFSIFNLHSPNTQYFDLSGRHIDKTPGHGIYIQNGKKHIVK